MPAPRLYLDEDVTQLVAQLLRRDGFDVTSAQELGNLEWSDERQLDFASTEGRVIFTYNVRHFELLARESTRDARHHAGILVSHSQYNIDAVGALVQRLKSYLSSWDASDVTDTYMVLPADSRDRA